MHIIQAFKSKLSSIHPWNLISNSSNGSPKTLQNHRFRSKGLESLASCSNHRHEAARNWIRRTKCRSAIRWRIRKLESRVSRLSGSSKLERERCWENNESRCWLIVSPFLAGLTCGRGLKNLLYICRTEGAYCFFVITNNHLYLKKKNTTLRFHLNFCLIDGKENFLVFFYIRRGCCVCVFNLGESWSCDGPTHLWQFHLKYTCNKKICWWKVHST